MNAAEYFRLVDALPVKDWRELTGNEPFVVLSPHPDDESLGVGGLIALARRHDQQVAVVLMTDGSKSHPNSRAYPRDRLVATRQAELAEAAKILGLPPDSLVELGLPDAAAPVEGRDFDNSVEAVGEVIARSGAKSLFVTWEHDPHCDHEAAARLAQEVRRKYPGLSLWAYPVWGWHLLSSREVPAVPPTGCRVAVDEVLDQKYAAIKAHVSQMTDLINDDPDCFRFTPEMLAPFLRPFEYYLEMPKR